MVELSHTTLDCIVYILMHLKSYKSIVDKFALVTYVIINRPSIGVGSDGSKTTKVKIKGAIISYYIEPLYGIRPKIIFDKKNDLFHRNL